LFARGEEDTSLTLPPREESVGPNTTARGVLLSTQDEEEIGNGRRREREKENVADLGAIVEKKQIPNQDFTDGGRGKKTAAKINRRP